MTHKYLKQWNIWPELLDTINNLEYFITCLGTGRPVLKELRKEVIKKKTFD